MDLGPQKQTKAYTARRLREDLNQAIGELMINKVVLPHSRSSVELFRFMETLAFQTPTSVQNATRGCKPIILLNSPLVNNYQIDLCNKC